MPSQIAPTQTGVSPQHPDIAMPGDLGNQYVRQRRTFVQPARRLMPQIVEVQIPYPGAPERIAEQA